MPRREELEISLRCPKCGNNGSAMVKESDASRSTMMRHRLNAEIVSISGDFRKSGSTEIVCARCFTAVPY
jgi:cytochrome c-type biogenesis protein CcmH/NrfF